MTDRILILDEAKLLVEMDLSGLNQQNNIELLQSSTNAELTRAGASSISVVVVVSDVPTASEHQFLDEVRCAEPNAIRVLCVAPNAHLQALSAVRHGQISWFAPTPKSPKELEEIIATCVDTSKKRRSEKQLFYDTLGSSIGALSHLLAISKPQAFAKGERVKRVVSRLCRFANVEAEWELEIAALLSQIGCISLPDPILDKVFSGERVDPSEAEQYSRHPEVGAELIQQIPTLGSIADLVRNHGLPWAKVDGDDPRFGIARSAFLKVAVEFDHAIRCDISMGDAIARMRKEKDVFAPIAVDALRSCAMNFEDFPIRKLRISDLEPGLTLSKDVVNTNGVVLITKGQKLSEIHIEQLRRRSSTIVLPIEVFGNTEIRCDSRHKTIEALKNLVLVNSAGIVWSNTPALG